MRVISQCGRGDFPYESTFLTIINPYKEQWFVYGYPFGIENNGGFRLAEYSSEEKAKKAMELLHETYVGKMFLTVNENVDFDNTAKELLKNATILCTPNVDVRPIGDSRNVVFRFPADDEI